VRDLISQALLNLDELLPAIKSAEEVIRYERIVLFFDVDRIAPGWADGYVTLARAQREFGEPELALANLNLAISIFHRRSSHSLEIFEEYPIHSSDSSLEEIQFELLELEGIVRQLEQRRQDYLTKKGLKISEGPCHETSAEIGDHTNHRLRQCLHNLCGRVRVVKEGEFEPRMDPQNLDG
jgi:tetratricopeptide (TPR) repeat protein